MWRICIFVFIISGCSQEDHNATDNNTAMFQENMECPEGTHAEIDSWGKSGYSRACKMKHGKFTGWEDGRKIYEAFYEYGKLVGKSYWYDEEGNVTKTIDHSEKN